MKKLLSILFIALLFSGSATADNNKFFADFTYWDDLKKVQKNFYAKGALDAWGTIFGIMHLIIQEIF